MSVAVGLERTFDEDLADLLASRWEVNPVDDAGCDRMTRQPVAAPPSVSHLVWWADGLARVVGVRLWRDGQPVDGVITISDDGLIIMLNGDRLELTLHLLVG